MMVTISSIAYAVRTASDSTPHPIKLSQAQQLVAAAFGYKSLAALQASEEEAEMLDDAVHFVLNKALLASRAFELNLPHDLTELELLFKAAFQERFPSARLHSSEEGLDGYIRRLVQDQVLNNENTSSAMAMTNNDGIREIYLPFDDVFLAALPALDELMEVEIDGHVAMEIDNERPYSGHMIDVRARLVLERKGRVCIADPRCEIVHAELDFAWGDDNNEDEIPMVSLAQALADELDLELSEAEELIDAEALPLTSNDGLLYGYVYDFSLHASPLVARKLIVKYGTLQVEVPAWFFDNVRRTEYR